MSLCGEAAIALLNTFDHQIVEDEQCTAVRSWLSFKWTRPPWHDEK